MIRIIPDVLGADGVAKLRAILDDPEASSNDKFVAFDNLKNANIAAGGVLEGAQARAKIEAGAALVQLYSGLIYRGPGLVRECVRATA